MVIKAGRRFVAAAWYRAGGAVQCKKFNVGIADIAISESLQASGEISAPPLRAYERRHVGSNHVFCGSIHADLAAVDPDAARAQILHRGHIVRYEEDSAPPALQPLHRVETLL